MTRDDGDFWTWHAWRTGRKVGRTIYAMVDVEPTDHDALIGMMDTAALAAEAVAAHNGHHPKCGPA